MRKGIFALTLLWANVALAQAPIPPLITPMTITSPSFSDGGVIADKHSILAAQPVSPAFAWSNAPAATVSFALILHDVDTDVGILADR